MAAENRVAIRDAGGIGHIVAAMERHDENASVQEQACAALCNLSFGNGRCHHGAAGVSTIFTN